ncbi:MAG: hypothetical protein H7841_15410 [Magnetospirillum sp. WYHS-4]
MGRVWICAGMILGLMAGPGAAKAECPAYPQVPWWENLTHDNTRRYVAMAHDGDWKVYLAKWRFQLADLEGIYGRGSAGLIRSHNIRLQGEDLRQYIEKVRARIDVVECLARETPILPKMARRSPAEAGDAEGEGHLVGKTAKKTALPGAAGAFQPEIETRCTTEGAIFRVVNRGALWPGQADFLVRLGGNPVAERRLRMAAGQTVEFRVDGKASAELRIVPDWDPLDIRKGQVTCP